MGQLQCLYGGVRPRPYLPGGQAVILAGKGHLTGKLRGKELAFGVLKNASHQTPDLPCGKRGYVLAVYPYAPAEGSGVIGRRKPVGKPCHGGLAAAGKPRQHDAFATFYQNGDVLYASVRVFVLKRGVCKLDHAMLLSKTK